MFNFITIENFLPPVKCEEILNFSLNNLKLKDAKIANKNSLDLLYRKSKVSFFDYRVNFPNLYNNIKKEIESNIKIKGHQFTFGTEPFQFTQYKVGEFYKWHKDIIPNTNRYCSLVLLLNDNYEGGELQIKSNDKIINLPKKIGNLHIFLSDIEHRVSEVNVGVRYSLVNWIGIKTEEKSFI